MCLRVSWPTLRYQSKGLQRERLENFKRWCDVFKGRVVDGWQPISDPRLRVAEEKNGITTRLQLVGNEAIIGSSLLRLSATTVAAIPFESSCSFVAPGTWAGSRRNSGTQLCPYAQLMYW